MTGKGFFSIIYRYDRAARDLEPWAVMDSMGDCSYPHLVETPTEVLCAYYSQHEDGMCKAFLCGYDKKAFLAGPPPAPNKSGEDGDLSRFVGGLSKGRVRTSTHPTSPTANSLLDSSAG